MRMHRLTYLIALALAAGCPARLAAQEEPPKRNEAMVSLVHGSFGSYPRSDDRIVSFQYYHSVSPELKAFGEVGYWSRYDLSDQPFGGGFYWKANEKDYLYCYGLFAVNPAVVSNADMTAEYTRVLFTAFTGSLAYRVMIFPGETVHILIPSVTVYSIPRWTITLRSYLSRLASVPDLENTLLLQVTYDWTDRFASLLTMTAGSETYRAGSIQDFSSAKSWSVSAGIRVQIGESIRLRLGYEYLKRIGMFEEHSLLLTPSFLW
jgi:YaiO family outer membrane protein